MNAMNFLFSFQEAWKSSPLEHEMTTPSHVDVFFNVIAGKCPSIDRKILAMSYSYRLMQVQQPHVYVLYDAAKKYQYCCSGCQTWANVPRCLLESKAKYYIVHLIVIVSST